MLFTKKANEKAARLGGFLGLRLLTIKAAAAVARYQPDNKQNKENDGEDYKCGKVCKDGSRKYCAEDKS